MPQSSISAASKSKNEQISNRFFLYPMPSDAYNLNGLCSLLSDHKDRSFNINPKVRTAEVHTVAEKMFEIELGSVPTPKAFSQLIASMAEDDDGFDLKADHCCVISTLDWIDAPKRFDSSPALDLILTGSHKVHDHATIHHFNILGQNLTHSTRNHYSATLFKIHKRSAP